ncbi:MAG: GH3 auxin-responsive promoter family protein [Clostridiales bacterium]|nr:GH3 auxin-responsive promoter family protein [Clostridiales bacterium]MDW7661947.1 GH3 auxin-responsive promoter family protein [Bacillota bacterium]
MNLQSKLREKKYDQIWNLYCGFLDLDIDGFMSIQNRLMLEQIEIWSNSILGKSVLKERVPKTIDEFRKIVPLTTYDDYADILLQKKAETLPENPVIWIQTTWEGGKHPIKVAPYTRSMLDVYKNNVTACLLLSTSKKKGHFNVSETDKILYGLAPLPYATGILPLLLNEEINIEFLPAVKEAEDMTFSERNKLGFKMAMKGGVDYFFGLGSVVYAISRSFGELNSKTSGGFSSLLKCKPKMIYRILRGKYISKKENRPMIPKDIFKLKGFMVAGTDNKCYKDDLEYLWGIRPMEIFAGTEPTVIGTETWTRSGMYFFPDSCFYEFISEKDMYRNLDDPNYQPPTYLMNEVIPGEKYELVISVLKGGAFARYRVGDVYRCVGLTNKEDDTRIPRFEYIDRVPTVIDIAGFTRISKNGIENALKLSGLKVVNWTAKKTYNDNNKPYMHLFIEMEENALVNGAVNTEIIKEILTTYFKYLDQDYRDLKKILGMDPLVVTILRCGTFSNYFNKYNKNISKINASEYELIELLGAQELQRSERQVI